MVTSREHSAKVLVIEAEPILRTLACSTLATAGHKALGVGPSEVFSTLATEPPDVIVVDVSSTEDLLEQLAATPRAWAIPIVAVGGTDLVRLAHAGVIEHVRQPYGYTELVTAVDAALAIDDVAFERERIRALADELAVR